MSKIEVDAITEQSGSTLTTGGGAGKTVVVDATTVTLGRCGGTVALASGASQTGFGRTGTVDWQTTPKTATFTAVSGEGYFANTTGSAFNMNLPAGSAGAIVSVADYAGTFQTNSLTIVPNGTDKIGGQNINVTLSTEGQSVTLVFVDATEGWVTTADSSENVAGNPFVVATGGTILTNGNFKTHIFTGPGTLCVSSAGTPGGSNTLDYFVVAGGGGGGGPYRGSAAGAGGFRLSNSVGCLPAPTMSPLSNPTGLTATVAAYPITVGGGGPGGTGGVTHGVSGSNSVFAGSSTITAAGGGGGKACNVSPGNGIAGGSGGGGSGCSSGSCGGAGNVPATPIAQGNPGGPSPTNPSFGGGGGGAGAAGTRGRTASEPATGNQATGGAGSFISDSLFGPTAPSYGTPGPTGSTRYFAGGGTGGNYPTPGPAAGGVGGGGAGGGGNSPYTAASGGTTNTGGGGGGASGPSASPAIGGGGGSGIVIIRYKFQ